MTARLGSRVLESRLKTEIGALKREYTSDKRRKLPIRPGQMGVLNVITHK